MHPTAAAVASLNWPSGDYHSCKLSRHDVYLLHGSEPNHSPRPRRGMTLRFMPTTSVFHRDIARQQSKDFALADHSLRTLYLMSGVDRSGRNDFRLRR